MAFAGWMLAHARIALFIVAVSLLIAVALDRIVRFLEEHGIPRTAGIAIVLLVWAGALAGIVLVFIPPLSSQLGALAEDAPELARRLQESDVVQYVRRHLAAGSLTDAAQHRASDAVASAIAIATGILGGVAGLVTVFFVVAFMLTSGRRLVASWLRIPRQHERWADAAGRIYGALAGYVIGMLLIVAINATLTSTFLVIAGIPWFLPLGLFSGIASLVPYVGALSAGAVLTVVAWASSGAWAAVATIAYYLVYQQVENHLIAPVVYRRTVDVNALVILVSALVLGEVFGIAGAVLAVPIAATGQIVARELLRGTNGRRTGDDVRGRGSARADAVTSDATRRVGDDGDAGEVHHA